MVLMSTNVERNVLCQFTELCYNGLTLQAVCRNQAITHKEVALWRHYSRHNLNPRIFYVILCNLISINWEINVTIMKNEIMCKLIQKLISMREHIYRMSHELRSLLRESVPYVKIYRNNPKHLCPKLNGYGDNGQRKVLTSYISAYCTSSAVSALTLREQCSRHLCTAQAPPNAIRQHFITARYSCAMYSAW